MAFQDREWERSLGGRRPISTSDLRLSDRIAKVVEERRSVPPSSHRQEAVARNDQSMSMRTGLLEPNSNDPFAYERILGRSDLLSINFLDRGRRSADAVCRIKLPMEGGHAYGTGFLVGPRLLVTNNHVLATQAEAAQAEAEFGYEHDLDGVVREPIRFNLDPHEVFFTSSELDFTLVAVTPIAESGVPIERYGWLPLIPLSGKTVDGEWVTIIQHPGSEPKQIAIHASQIIKLDPDDVGVNLEHFIHYSTDTEPGSSGAPVFNDQWQVVAIHHKAVPAPAKDEEGEPEWLANEGIRISAIFNHLECNRMEDDDARRALDRLARGLGFSPLVQPAVPVGEPDPGEAERRAPYPRTRWRAAKLGYDEDFLKVPLPLGPMYEPLRAQGKVAPLLDKPGHELRYFHFSSVVHAERRFALLTAVNIDGERLVHPGERVDTWRRDARMADEYQPDDDFYVRTRAAEKVYFSRGHLVRLLDPCWSDAEDPAQRAREARRGMEDSFHFTNAAPQVQTYNDQDWGNLEDYVLDKAQTSERRLTVFTGPIFRDSDPVYGRKRKGGPWRIPLSYWKIAVLQKTQSKIAAAAFIIGQTEYVRALYEARVFSGLKPYTVEEMRQRTIQTTIRAVEAETGLDFGPLRKFDAQGSLESTRQTRWIDRVDSILI